MRERERERARERERMKECMERDSQGWIEGEIRRNGGGVWEGSGETVEEYGRDQEKRWRSVGGIRGNGGGVWEGSGETVE